MPGWKLRKGKYMSIHECVCVHVHKIKYVNLRSLGLNWELGEENSLSLETKVIEKMICV